MRTLHGAWRTTFSATEPRRTCLSPLRPCVPITTRSHRWLRADLTISSHAIPTTHTVSTVLAPPSMAWARQACRALPALFCKIMTRSAEQKLASAIAAKVGVTTWMSMRLPPESRARSIAVRSASFEQSEKSTGQRIFSVRMQAHPARARPDRDSVEVAHDVRTSPREPAQRSRLASTHDDDAARRVAGHALCHRAEGRTLDVASAARAHDDQVGPVDLRQADDLRPRHALERHRHHVPDAERLRVGLPPCDLAFGVDEQAGRDAGPTGCERLGGRPVDVHDGELAVLRGGQARRMLQGQSRGRRE